MDSQNFVFLGCSLRHEALKYGKNDDVLEKGNFPRIPKMYRNLSLLISFFEIFLLF